jgi:phage tail protein X
MLLVSVGAMSLLVAKDIVPNSWINTRVTYDISVKELAERYYGDASEYKVILNANRGLIGKNLIVPKNTEIQIPITEKFTDQPEMLGWN